MFFARRSPETEFKISEVVNTSILRALVAQQDNIRWMKPYLSISFIFLYIIIIYLSFA